MSETANGAAAAPREVQQAEDVARAQEAGWASRVPYNYEGGDGNDQVWLSNAAVYEWNDEFGDVGPPNPELERMLYADPDKQQFGQHLGVYDGLDVKSEGAVQVAPVREFKDAGLHPVMLENIKLCNYPAPTAIQSYCIPAVVTGHDVIAIAQTGSGKTAAFFIPILSKLMGKASKLSAPRPNPTRYNRHTDRVRAEPLVLVICPTRELACQIFDEARRLCYRSKLRPCVIYGGAPIRAQREQLEMGCDILIATPGRFLDFKKNPQLLSFRRLRYTVIDEADELLSSGWEETIESLFKGGDVNPDENHTYLMFSATFSKSARRLAKEYLTEDCLRIKIGRVGSSHANIIQSIVYTDEDQKNNALYNLIMAGEAQRTLVFTNSKMKCDMVDDFLYNKQLPVTSLHSDRTQREREDAIRAFRTGKCPIMVATGVTARGLDVSNIKHVINYDLPSMDHGGIDEYVHRIGRTGRIGNIGQATSFYNERNEDIAPALVKLLLETKQEIPDFLEGFKPDDPENITYKDGTDDESDDGFGGGFGTTGDDNNGFGSFGGDSAEPRPDAAFGDNGESGGFSLTDDVGVPIENGTW